MTTSKTSIEVWHIDTFCFDDKRQPSLMFISQKERKSKKLWTDWVEKWIREEHFQFWYYNAGILPQYKQMNLKQKEYC